MSRKIWIGLLLIPGVLHAQEDLDGWEEAAGVNLSLEEGFGARHSGMAVTFAGFQTDANAVANGPAAMNDIDDFTFSTGHAEKFGEAKFDDFALVIPFESRSTLGLGLSRYGVSGIDRYSEDVSPLNSQPLGQFSIADYLVTAAFSRRWGGLDVGAGFNFIYRQLDQDGMGMRADAMAQYTLNDRFRAGALLKGLIPSSVSWESGYSEFESPDLYLGFGARFPAPYFYGTLHAAYQTEGLFQKQAKSQTEASGDRFLDSPGKALQMGNAGMEFLFDFGLAVRFGFTEFGLGKDMLSASTFGIGYAWRKILGLDYSFAPNPQPGLLSSHRVSLQFTPAFPKFDGRGFRPGRAPESRVPSKLPADYDPTGEESPGGESLDDDEPSAAPPAPPPPAKIESTPSPATPSAPNPPANAAPAPPAPPAPRTKPAPAQPEESLEEEEMEEGE